MPMATRAPSTGRGSNAGNFPRSLMRGCDERAGEIVKLRRGRVAGASPQDANGKRRRAISAASNEQAGHSLSGTPTLVSGGSQHIRSTRPRVRRNRTTDVLLVVVGVIRVDDAICRELHRDVAAINRKTKISRESGQQGSMPTRRPHGERMITFNPGSCNADVGRDIAINLQQRSRTARIAEKNEVDPRLSTDAATGEQLSMRKTAVGVQSAVGIDERLPVLGFLRNSIGIAA